jgi:ubiquinone biosynthesis protein COQ9
MAATLVVRPRPPYAQGLVLSKSLHRGRLLQLALPLVPKHGFTRQALALSVLSLARQHVEPLSETAVTALFGEGDDARRLLVQCWLNDARQKMKENADGKQAAMADVLKSRLKVNEEVLEHLPEVCMNE